jgi:Flp pilus assembly pilin Flp
MVEYGLVISLVVIGGVGAYTLFGNQINTGLTTVFGRIATAL